MPFDFVYAVPTENSYSRPGITVGYKCDKYKTIIEFPLEGDKLFTVLNYLMLDPNGSRMYSRKVFEIYRSKKLKPLITENFDIIEELDEEQAVFYLSYQWINQRKV